MRNTVFDFVGRGKFEYSAPTLEIQTVRGEQGFVVSRLAPDYNYDGELLGTEKDDCFNF